MPNGFGRPKAMRKIRDAMSKIICGFHTYYIQMIESHECRIVYTLYPLAPVHACHSHSTEFFFYSFHNFIKSHKDNK